MSAWIKLLQTKFCEMDEATLQQRIVEPLLRAEGFTNVRDNSGPNEKGRDLIATKTELGTTHTYGIQIKRLKITGRVGKISTSLMGLIDQLKQSITEEWQDRSTLSKRIIDRLVFITPFSVGRPAVDAAFESLRGLAKRQIVIMDGETLAEESLNYIPEIVAELCGEIGYRARLAQEFNIIHESRAFGLATPLQLDKIYVPTDYTCFDDLRLLLNGFVLGTEERKHATGHPGAAPNVESDSSLREHMTNSSPLSSKKLRAKQWATAAPTRLSLSKAEMTCLLHGAAVLMGRKAGAEKRKKEGSATEFIDEICRFTAKLIDEIREAGPSTEKATLRHLQHKILMLQRVAIDVRNSVDLRKVSLLASSSSMRLVEKLRSTLDTRIAIKHYHLCHCNFSLIIVGPAGYGKTTLLRVLLRQSLIEDSDTTVAAGRAVDIQDASVEGVLRHLHSGSHLNSSKEGADAFRSLLHKGKVRLMIDGLDEAGDRCDTLARSLLDISSLYDRCPITVTSRDTVNLPKFSGALHLRLCPFDNEQLEEFVKRWYSSQPTASRGLSTWLEHHSKMKDSARTPLVAALMCSLYQVGESIMPISEMELYERRLEFLLGRWEQAKSIQAMTERMRSRYMLFLMQLAYDAHEAQSRSIPRELALKKLANLAVRDSRWDYEYVIQDCIGRGLIELLPDGKLTLGHLAYQEHLVGRYLHKYNDPSKVASKLGREWWHNALLFYAYLIADMKALLDFLSPSERRRHREQLTKMAEAAEGTPYWALF
jgi:hypothetical protein